MPVTSSWWSISDSFSGSGALHGRKIERLGGLLGSYYPNATWNTFAEGGIVRSNGYARMIDEVLTADLNVNLGNPARNAPLRSFNFPSATSFDLDMGFDSSRGGFLLPLIVTVNTDLSFQELDGQNLSPFADPDDMPEMFFSQMFLVVGVVGDPEVDTLAFGSTSVNSAVRGFYQSAPGDTMGILAMFYIGLNTKTGSYQSMIYMFLYNSFGRVRVVLENNSSRYVLRVSERPGLMLRGSATDPQITDLGDLSTVYRGSTSPSDLRIRDGFSRIYSLSQPGLEMQGDGVIYGDSYNNSYPRLHGFEFRQGSYGGWKVGMI